MFKKYVFLSIFFLIFFLSISQVKAWWDSDWESRRPITITNNYGSVLLNYSIRINLTYDSDMQPDFSDIRFANSSDYELKYWIENYTTSSEAYIWVNNTVTPTGDSTIYVYYKNSTPVSTTSDPNATFLFWDDFNRPDVADICEVEENYGNCRLECSSEDRCSISNNILKLNAVGKGGIILYVNVIKTDLPTTNYAVSIKVNATPAGRSIEYGHGPGVYAPTDNTGYLSLLATDQANELSIAEQTTILTSKDYPLVIGRWYRVETARYGDNINASINGTHELSTTDSTLTSGDPSIASWNYEQVAYFDDLFVRQYVSPEPTYSVGSEETGKQPPQYSDIIVDPPSPQTYGISNIWFNITWEDDTSVDDAWIKHNFNGSLETYFMSNETPSNFSYKLDFVPSAGTYDYTFYANNTPDGAKKKTSTFTYTINKASTTIYLAINGTEDDVTVIYPNITNATAWKTVNGGTLSLERNKTSVSNPEIIGLAAGIYNYTTFLDHENYTANPVTRILTVKKRDSELSLTSSLDWNLFAGETTIIDCTATPYADPSLKIEESYVTPPYSLQVETGIYDVWCGITDLHNFTNSNTSNTINVNPLAACTDNSTFAFNLTVSTSTSITTLNFTDLANQSYVRRSLGDVYVEDVNNTWANFTNGYYIVVNNSGKTSFVVKFGNYFINRTYSERYIENVQNVTGYSQENYYIIYNVLDELMTGYLSPPNTTLMSIIRCSLGENYISVDEGDTRFLIASKAYLEKASLRIKYTADMYYSRQFYPDEADKLILNFYVVDAYKNALDRIDFKMLDVRYYNSKLQMYKNISGFTIIITEGYFDVAHYFSAYLMEDSDYWLRTVNPDGSFTEFGRITIVKPEEKELGKVTLILNPEAVYIADKIFMNAFVDEEWSTIYVDYADELSQTNWVVVTIWYENGTVFQNDTFTSDFISTSYDISGQANQSYSVLFTVSHETLGTSPIKYPMSLLKPIFWDIGVAGYIYQLFSIGILIFIGGLATRRNLIGSIILFVITFLILIGLGWMDVANVWVLFVFTIILGILTIVTHLQKGRE